jgi:hypothetical protein
VDPNLVPDVWFYADSLRKSFEELMAAAERAGAATRPPVGEEKLAAAGA